MATGWQDIGRYRYYLKPEAGTPMGAMATGLFEVDGKMYLAGEKRQPLRQRRTRLRRTRLRRS